MICSLTLGNGCVPMPNSILLFFKPMLLNFPFSKTMFGLVVVYILMLVKIHNFETICRFLTESIAHIFLTTTSLILIANIYLSGDPVRQYCHHRQGKEPNYKID